MHTIAVIAYDGISPFHLSVPCIVFGDDLLRLGAPRYELRVCAERTGAVSTLSGFAIQVEHDLAALEQADTVIIPSWSSPEAQPSAAMLAALQQAHARGARVVGLCLGTFVLAQAGLLQGRSASTHWAWADDFAKDHPEVKLDRHALYTDGGNITTSAGTAAAIDCCLHLIRLDHGAEIANRVARRLVVAPHRHGNQSQYIEMPLSETERPDAVSAALDWAMAHLNEPINVEQLAQKAHMSARNFSRHFKRKTGATVVQWLLHQRLAVAQRLLERGDGSIDQVAETAGFGSTVSFRLQFTRMFSISPASYRKQFLHREV